MGGKELDNEEQNVLFPLPYHLLKLDLTKHRNLNDFLEKRRSNIQVLKILFSHYFSITKKATPFSMVIFKPSTKRATLFFLIFLPLKKQSRSHLPNGRRNIAYSFRIRPRHLGNVYFSLCGTDFKLRIGINNVFVCHQ